MIHCLLTIIVVADSYLWSVWPHYDLDLAHLLALMNSPWMLLFGKIRIGKKPIVSIEAIHLLRILRKHLNLPIDRVLSE